MTRSSRKKTSKSGGKEGSGAEPVGLFRRLEKELSGAIFGCTSATYDECIRERVFGLPYPHFCYVQRIQIGMPLFLFNYTKRELHGVFVATSPGQMNIRPSGWTVNGKGRTTFPAQVKIKVHKKAKPLKEHQFKPAILGNYDREGPLFLFELDGGQVKRLCRLFNASVPQVPSAQRPTILAVPKTEPRHRRTKLPLAEKEDATERLSSGGEEATAESEAEDGLLSNGSFGGGGSQNRRRQRTRRRRSSMTRSLSQQDGRSDTSQRRSPSPTANQIRPLSQRRLLGNATGIFAATSIPPANVTSTSTRGKADTSEEEMAPPGQDLLMQCLENKQKHLCFAPHKDRETVLLFGGLEEEDCFAQMEILLPDVASWKESLFIPGAALINGHALSVEGSVYLLGGGIQEHCPSRNVELLKAGWSKWKPVESLPCPRSHFAAASLRSCICIAGGGRPHDASASCEMYDCAADMWLQGPDLKGERYGPAACGHGTTFVVAGGSCDSRVSSSVEMLDIRSPSWIQLPPLPSPRLHHRVAFFQQQLWAVGGRGTDGSFLSSVDVFDLRSQEWIPGPELCSPRAFFTLDIIEGALHVMGGLANPDLYRFLGGERLKGSGDGWQEGIAVGTTGKRGYHSSCVVNPVESNGLL